MNKPTLFKKRMILLGVVGALPLLFGQACGKFGAQFAELHQSAASSDTTNNPTSTSTTLPSPVQSQSQLFSCAAGSTYQNGICESNPVPGAVTLAGANQTSVAFGSGFQKFVYSAPLPGNVNFTGLSGKIAIDSNSPYFSEALFTVGYSPTGVCPAQGSTYMEYSDVFNAMPGAQILQQYIIKIVGGHLELPTNFTLTSPVPAQGCAFVIMDGDAGYKGSVDTMTSAINFNFTQSSQDTNNRLVDAAGGEYCYGLSTGCTSSSTNQFRTVSAVIGSNAHLSQLSGSISAAPLYIYKATSLPQGAWNVRNLFYLDKGCTAGASGVFTGQDFFSEIPSTAVSLMDLDQTGNGGNVQQQSIAQIQNVDVAAGDCIVQLLQVSGGGPLDVEVQVKANIGDLPATAAAIPTVDLVSISGESPVYQLSDGNGQNLYVTGKSVIPNGFGLVSGEPAFMVLNSEVNGSVALQRCIQGTDHFLSVDPGCEGSDLDPSGPVGFVLTQSSPGAVALFRDRSDDYTQVVEQIDATPLYDVQEVLGYVGSSKIAISVIASSIASTK